MAKRRGVDAETEKLISEIKQHLLPQKQFPVWTILFQILKMNATHKIIIVTAFDGDRTEFQASFTVKIDASTDTEWRDSPVGRRELVIFTLADRGKTLVEKFKGFFSRSITEGKLQDFLGFFK